MPALSKSKLIASLQCPRRLWLEVHCPELSEHSAASQAAFAAGRSVGEVARKLYDPKGLGILIDVGQDGTDAAIARTRDLLLLRRPIFEAGFEARGAKAFADVLIPTRRWGEPTWRMVEVKSSAQVHDYQRNDIAIQAYVARKAHLPLSSVAIAHVDTSWVYPGDDEYHGLLIEDDMTEEAFDRARDVKEWIAEAQTIAASRKEPEVLVGSHCREPYECGFLGYCTSREPRAKYPVDWLPRVQSKALRELIEEKRIRDMRRVPDELLSEPQLRVKDCTLRNTRFFDAKGAAEALAPHGFPAYFLDFETIHFAVPIWKGTRPYEQIPFQFSLHRLSRSGKLEHEAFIDLTGSDPSRALAEAVIAGCGDGGPVYAYHAPFEALCLDGLAQRFPKLRRPLQSIIGRLVDLHPIAKQHYYHPAQEGSWSLKSVLPTATPDLDYAKLDGVKDGGMAIEAYREAINPATAPERHDAIRNELLAYCRLDTFALVRLWQHFSGRFPHLPRAAWQTGAL